MSKTAVLHYSYKEYVSVDLMLFVISLQVCPNGYLSLENGAGCRACPDGYSCDPRSGVQRSCGPGQYSLEGELECQECPERYVCPDGRSRQVLNERVTLQGQIFQGLNVNVLSKEDRLPWFNSKIQTFLHQRKAFKTLQWYSRSKTFHKWPVLRERNISHLNSENVSAQVICHY